MKAKTIIIIIFVSMVIGVLLGRRSVEDKDPIIKYEKGDTITDSIPYPVPYDSIITEYVKLPQITDTLYLDGDTVFTKSIDTVAIVIDYAILRKYREVLFDNDTVGYLSVDNSVQYNKLINTGYKFTPIIKQIKSYKEPLFIPYITGSYSTLGYIGAGGGVFIKDLGFQVKYLNNLELTNPGWEFGLVKKF